MEKPVILCVDDEKSVLNALRDEIKFEFGNEYSIEIADNGEEGLEIIKEFLSLGVEIPVVISDQLMPGMKGDEFLTFVYQTNPAIKTILLTGQASAESVGNAVNSARLYRFVSKPWDGKDLLLTIEQAAKSYFMDVELDARIQVLKDINESAESLTKEINLKKLAFKILENTIKHTGSDRVVIFLHKPVDDSYEILEGEIKDSTVICNEIDTNPDIPKTYPESVINLVIDTKQKFLSEKIAKDPILVEDPYIKRLKAEKKGIKSLLCIPILRSDILIGLIYLESFSKSSLFSGMIMEYLETVGRLITANIDNALVYQSLESLVNERTSELNHQKELLIDKNQDLTDSIFYARRIQRALLADSKTLAEKYPNSFILFHPKDIVSGDFYWFADIDGLFFVAVVDCTGHGVPGAFMSVLGNSILNEVIIQSGKRETDEILNELNDRIVANLERSNEGVALMDGMDIALVRICTKSSTIQFSGAKRPLILFRDGKMIELEPNKSSIGYNPDLENLNSFTSESIDYQPKDCIYLFSDGIADQFGGEHNRKYGKKSLVTLLESLSNEPMDTVGDSISSVIKAWQGSKIQTDDMLMIGIGL